MPLSYAQSSGDGSTRTYDLPFEYLSRSHVSVTVNGNPVPFTWTGTYTIQTATAPAAGSVVERRRITPRKERLVSFTDGSTLVASDLNTSTLQAFFLTQEAFDQGEASLAVTPDGQYSAQTRRITNLGNPVNDQDAVTKAWALSASNTNLAAANAARAAAEAAKTGAESARAGAQTARTGAETARTGAETARTEAQAARDSASGHRLNAQNASTAASAALSGAETARDTALNHRDAAGAHRSAAEAAQLAAEAARDRSEAAAGISEKPLSYAPQTLTEAEKQQARANIGALQGSSGPGSGLDADLLDGQHGDFYRDASNLNAGTVPASRLPDIPADKIAGPLPASLIPAGILPTPTSTSDADWNTAVTPGWSNRLHLRSAPNGPGGTGYGYVLVVEYAGINVAQIVLPYATAEGIQYRTRHSGAWNAWKSLLPANLTSISDLAGALPNEKLEGSYNKLVNLTASGWVQAGSSGFWGVGTNLTALNASNFTTGVLGVARGGTGYATEAGARGVYTGAVAANNTYPVGTTLLVADSGGTQVAVPNTAVSIRYLSTGTPGLFTIASTGGTAIAGTWRIRGASAYGSPRGYLVQRTA